MWGPCYPSDDRPHTTAVKLPLPTIPRECSGRQLSKQCRSISTIHESIKRQIYVVDHLTYREKKRKAYAVRQHNGSLCTHPYIQPLKGRIIYFLCVQGGCEGRKGRGRQAETSAPSQATQPAASSHDCTAEPLGS